MESFIIKLAVATLPLFVLVVFITFIPDLSSWLSKHPLAWHRKRRTILRTLAGGVTLR